MQEKHQTEINKVPHTVNIIRATKDEEEARIRRSSKNKIPEWNLSC